MTIADLIYKAPKKRTKIALDGGLELKDRKLVSFINYINSNAYGKKLQQTRWH